jgi:hypothetical protein
MRKERNREDNREATYFPNIEKVKTEQSVSESIEFIQSLSPNFKFGEARSQMGKFHSTCSVFSNIEETPQKTLKQTAEKMAKLFLASAPEIVESSPGASSSFKIAYIATLERKGVKP